MDLLIGWLTQKGEVLEMEPFTLLYDLINHELKDT